MSLENYAVACLVNEKEATKQRRQEFAERSSRLVLRDSTYGREVAYDGRQLEKQLNGLFLAVGKSKGGTERYEGPLKVSVGARLEGNKDLVFEFPDGCQLRRTGRTIVVSGIALSVTFTRDIGCPHWRFVGRMESGPKEAGVPHREKRAPSLKSRL